MNGYFKKGLVFGITILFLGAGVLPSFSSIVNSENGKTIGIMVLFDSSYSTTRDAADEVYNTLLNYYDKVDLKPISSSNELINELSRHCFISVYFFHGSDEGMKIKNDTISWDKLGSYINASPIRWHIIESCSSLKLNTINNVHGINTGTDVVLAKVDALYQISEKLLESYQPEETKAGQEIYSEFYDDVIFNLFELINRSFLPVKTLDGKEELKYENSSMSGVWGWLIKKALGLCIGGAINRSVSIDYRNGTGFITIDTGDNSSVEMSLDMPGLGGGDKSSTGIFPFEIPLDFDVKPEALKEKNPWYKKSVILNIKATPKRQISLSSIPAINGMFAAVGFIPNITIEPELHAGLLIRNFIFDTDAQVLNFLGGGCSIMLHLDLFIPAATIINFLIPGTGTAVANILKILGIEIGVLPVLELILGYDYVTLTHSSQVTITLRFLVNIMVKAEFGIGSILKRVTGIDIPVNFITVGFVFKAGAGFAARTILNSTGACFQIGVPYNLLMKISASIAWVFSISWKKTWEDTKWYPQEKDTWSVGIDKGNSILDKDMDGVSDEVEKNWHNKKGDALVYTNPDTDGDGLSDGNELMEFFTDPTKKDTDFDKLDDSDELDYWYEKGLDPYVDYDGDTYPCPLDRDSDNEGVKDGGTDENMSNNNVVIYTNFGEETIYTDPSIPDTDNDGLTDYEEAAPFEFNHTYFCDSNPMDILNTTLDEYFGLFLKAGQTNVDTNKLNQSNFIVIDSGTPDGFGNNRYALFSKDPIGSRSKIDETGTKWVIHGKTPQCCSWYKPTPNSTILFNVTNPIMLDTDYDGLIDGFEKSYFEKRTEYQRKYNWSTADLENSGPYDDFDGDGLKNIVDYDSDNDWLSDGEEFKFGTDPLDMDTDGDYDINNDGDITGDEILSPGNLSDWWESGGNYNWPGYPLWGVTGDCEYPRLTKTDPLKKDSDGDKVNDNQEWKQALCPVDMDHDGDGVSTYAENNIYHTDCGNSDTDSDGIRDGIEKNIFEGLGITDTSTIGRYLNTPDVDGDGLRDGIELQYGTDILRRDTDNDGLWDSNERWLFGIDGWVLNEDNGTDPLNNDTDGDGIEDGKEVEGFHTNPLKVDTDGDGLTDLWEIRKHTKTLYLIGNITYKTDPLDPDSDDDGISDGDEVQGWHWAINRMLKKDIFTDDLWGERVKESKIDKRGPKWWILDNETVFNFPDPYRAQFETNPSSPDTDSDGLLDGEEKANITSPLTNDTDCDKIPDVEEIEFIYKTFQTYYKDFGFKSNSNQYWNRFDIWHYLDFDKDGLSDNEEWNLGKSDDKIKWLLICTNDTDNDGLTDWQEVKVPVIAITKTTSDDINSEKGVNLTNFNYIQGKPKNESELIDPSNWEKYITNESIEKKYTNPIDNDSDDDKINDGDELNRYATNPLDSDTDDDGLSDYEEIMLYKTDPLQVDTDLDGPFSGWTDKTERDRWIIYGISSNNHELLSKYMNDPDSDGDGIVDGVEFMKYTPQSFIPGYILNNTELKNYSEKIKDFKISSDPLKAYIINNYVKTLVGTSMLKKDGYYTDYDQDGLSDYQEYYLTPPGYGKVNMEYLNSLFSKSDAYNASSATNLSKANYSNATLSFVNHTCYCINDTDGDSLLDGYEVDIGTDPLKSNSDNDGMDDKLELEYFEKLRVEVLKFPKVPRGGPFEDYDLDGYINILDYDSDNDHFSDGVEYLKKTDPLNAESFPMTIVKPENPEKPDLIPVVTTITVVASIAAVGAIALHPAVRIRIKNIIKRK
jgi:hypothetical protein